MSKKVKKNSKNKPYIWLYIFILLSIFIAIFTFSRSFARNIVSDMLGLSAHATSSSTITPTPIVTDGLVAYFTMDESSWVNDCNNLTVIDSTSNNNHGKSCPAGTGSTGGAAGRWGRAGALDGYDDFLKIENSPSLSLGTNVSFSLWVYKRYESNYGAYISKNLAGWYQILNYGGSGKVVFRVGEDIDTVVSTATVPLNTWTHIVGTYDGQIAKIYVNGQANSVSVNKSITNDATPIYIGRRVDGSVVNNVIIDDFRIYNRALSDSEIQQLYQQPFPTPTNTPTPTLTPTPRPDIGYPINKKILVINYDPYLPQRQRKLSSYYGDPVAIAQLGVDYFKQITNSRLNYSIVKRNDIDAFAPKKYDPQFTEDLFFQCVSNPGGLICGSNADWDGIIEDNGVCEMVNGGEIDEVWIQSHPFAGFWESALTGPKNLRFNYNGPTMTLNNCNKLVPLQLAGYGGFDLHVSGHRGEATMTKVYGRWRGGYRILTVGRNLL